MKRIDLHIHTVRTLCDPQNYTFDLDVLKRYVETAHLDAIAVANHNLFDRANYEVVSAGVDIPVFPGIEINVKTPGKYGHVLVIAPADEVDEFADAADNIAGLLPESDSSIAWEQVRSTFPDIAKYLVIPHYRKDKQLDQNTIGEIRETTGIDALEVANAKKWLRAEGTTEEPLVMFSDSRPGLRMNGVDDNDDSDPRRYAYGFTYVACDEMSVPALKRAFAAGSRTSVFRNEDTFEILPEALPASGGLNVVIGNRTSGKTYTLGRIADGYDSADVARIGQFEITKSAEEKQFDALVTEEDVKFEGRYLRPLQNELNHYCNCDVDGDRDGVKTWAEALVMFANSPEDDASKTPIYRAHPYDFTSEDSRLKKDVELRNAIRRIAGERERADLVARYLSVDKLMELDAALRSQMLEDVKTRLAKERANAIVAAAKKRLEGMSARKPLPDRVPLRNYLRSVFYERRLGDALDELLKPENLDDTDVGKFLKKRKRMPVEGAKEARKRQGVTVPTGVQLVDLYKQTTGIGRLRLLKGFPNELKPVSSKLLVQVKSSIVDKNRGTPLSGGQRAEYVFLNKLKGAHGKDIVLIDEPEASFDNVFLGAEISDALHRLAEDSTVFLVTHNNTLGVSINPDWVIYTAYDDGEFKVFSGAMSSSELAASSGETVSRREVLMATMEAGWDAYEGRRSHYDLAKDRR